MALKSVDLPTFGRPTIPALSICVTHDVNIRLNPSEVSMSRIALSTSAVVLAAMMIGGATSAPRPFDEAQGRPGVDWPQFRGIAAGGVADGASLPDKWNATDGTNVIWKTPIPGLGLSSPVVWGNDVFISTS